MAQTTIKDNTLSGLGKVNRLLPSGTVFLYQFLSPVLSNNGHCSTTTICKYLTAILVAVCGLSCFFSSFTDSYVGDDGKTHYGVVTSKGLWTLEDGVVTSKDLRTSEDSKNSDYMLQLGDFVHGLLSLAAFGVLVLLDHKTVGCFYPVSAALEKYFAQGASSSCWCGV
nr:protein DMP2-like [Quercus suber]POE53824.1 hypothetical protein CFP56_66353 [Quercus suber]